MYFTRRQLAFPLAATHHTYSSGRICPQAEMAQRGGGGCSPPHHPSPRSSPHPCSRIHPGQGSSMPGLFISLVSRETFWQSLAGNVISLPLHVPTGTEMQGSLNICFLNLGNSRSLLPCNTQSVSFIKSCPGKCLIHSCRRPTVGRARAFKTLGGGRQ